MSIVDIYDNLDVVMNQGVDMISYYISDPVMAAYDLLNIDLAPIQRVILRDMWFKNFTISVVSRGGGKTFLLGVNAVLHALLYPGYRVGLMAPSFRQCFFDDLKCFPIFTNKGLLTSPIEFYNSIDEDTKIQSLEGINNISNKWVNEEQEGLIIKTDRGFEIGGLYNHRVLTIDDSMDLVYKELQHITKDDNIVIKKGFELFGNNDGLPVHELSDDWRTNGCIFPEKLTPDLSYLFGLVVGDGCISYRPRKYRVNLTSGDNELIESFRSYIKEYFGIGHVSDYQKENTTMQMDVYNKNLCDFLLECGFTKTTALDKKIPFVINKASMENIAAFLSGLMDTDGGVSRQGNGCTVDLSTSSLRLAKEVQAWFLNLGILSSLTISRKSGKRKLNGRDKESICATAYKVRITDVLDMIRFRDRVGFRLSRKKNELNNYINSVNFNKIKNSYVIPNSERHVKRLVYDCDKLFKYGDTYQNKFLGYFKNKFGRTGGFTKKKIMQLLEFTEQHNILTNEYYKLKKIVDMDLAFVKPKEFTTHRSRTIDIEVENEHCYFAGGFINHNSKMIFFEVEKIYQRSSIVREAAIKPPTRGADTCSLEFRATDKSNGSYIAALPIGVDGAKIRGSRFYLVQIDELAQMPTEIIDMVIRPMAVTFAEPMQRVRERERQDELVRKGLANEEDFIDDSANKMIMTSSGYFKFNHMWNRMKSYWSIMKDSNGPSNYAIHQVPYQLLPKGFLDEENIREARRTMSTIEFMMEYEAAMVSDSDGFFKASMLDACTVGSEFSIQLTGAQGKEYVIGVDPSMGGSAACGVVIVELGDPHKIVYVKELKGKTTQKMTLSIQDLVQKFNVVRIFMDSQGGGKPIRDLLQEGYGGNTPILDIDDDLTKGHSGRRVLKMVNPTVQWINDANFDTLALIEHKDLRFPALPIAARPDPISEKLYEEVRLLKSQMLNIVVTQTVRGSRHFDTPAKGQNKDLYSAIILAGWGVRELHRESKEQIQVLQAQGLVRQRGSGSRFTRVDSTISEDYMKFAIPKQRV